MTRSDFRKLAEDRLRDARALFAARRYSGAYYLAGYVVECALKACIARLTRRFDFPDKKTAADSHTHNLERLVGLAGLEADFKARQSADPVFKANWTIVEAWTETSRYEQKSRAEADDLIRAVSEPGHGVLQ